MAINKLDFDKIKAFTNGYLYSQGKDGLLESLRGPFANRATSPLKQLQSMYEQMQSELKRDYDNQIRELNNLNKKVMDNHNKVS